MKLLLFTIVVIFGVGFPASGQMIGNIHQNGTRNIQRSNEEPPYRHVPSVDKVYQERDYDAQKWVSTHFNYTTADRISAYMRLLYYTQGNNTNGIIIPRTLPAVIDVIQGNVTSYSYSFYLGRNFQGNPPKPFDSSVFIQERPDMIIYTRQFGGYPSQSDFKVEEEKLRAILKADGKHVQDGNVIEAYYTPPWKTTNRRNELWIIGR